MSEIETFRGHAAQSRLMAAYTTDRRIRVVLEVLSEELEHKIMEIENPRRVDSGLKSVERNGPRAHDELRQEL